MSAAATAPAHTAPGSTPQRRYPAAVREDVRDQLHGHEVHDPYRWLEDGTTPATTAWVAAQQQLSRCLLDGLDGQDRMHDLLESLTVGPGESPVKAVGDRRFRASRSGGDGWSVEAATAEDAPWRTVFSPAGPRTTVWRWDPSPRGRLLAVQVVEAGSEASTPLTVVDVDAGTVLERTDLTRYTQVEWTADESAFFHVRRHLDGSGSGVYRHRVGTPASEDELVVGDDDPFTRYQATLWHDRWLVVGTRYGTNRSGRVAVVDSHQPGAVPVPLHLKGASAAGVLVDSTGRLLAVSTAGAEFGRLLACDGPGQSGADGAGYVDWRVLVPEVPPQSLSGTTLLRSNGQDRLVLMYAVDGCSRITVHDPATGELLTPIRLPGDGTVSALRHGPTPGTLVVVYSDWVTQLSVWHADVRTGETTPAGLVETLRDRVTVTRTTYTSADGVQVPLTVLSPAGSAPGTPLPAVLTCYGGFGMPFRPSWQPEGLAWVLAGGVMAVAGVRGGGERGRAWHRAGTREGRLTTLADLHAAADRLVADGWTTPDRLALMGGSNGGLMVTAAAVQRPERYAVLVASGAPLDMVRYELSGLGPAWRDEYGSASDPAALPTLLAYSPYHNVPTGRRVPACLFSVGANDTRVDPLHSRKTVARLQAETTGGPVLLTVVEGAGHVGGGEDAGRSAAQMLAFVAAGTGLTADGEAGAPADGTGQPGQPPEPAGPEPR